MWWKVEDGRCSEKNNYKNNLKNQSLKTGTGCPKTYTAYRTWNPQLSAASSTELELESSDDSAGEEGVEEAPTTSWEDMSKLDPNLLLYKAAEARNLPVMLEALANGADPNWVNADDEDKTPIMKAVETVSCFVVLL